MLTTLDHLEYHIHNTKDWSTLSNRTREIKIFATIFVVVFVTSTLTTNAQLYKEAVVDLVQQWTGNVTENIENIKNIQNIKNIHNVQNEQVDKEFLAKKMLIEEINNSVEAMSMGQEKDFVAEDIVQSDLKQGLASYNMSFNTLPPADRVIIPEIDINVPLLQSSFNKNIAQITKEDMDKDLYNGVVQYPTTPHAGQDGNMLIFWHTSYEARKHNPYATVFSKLPKLKEGSVVQIVQWNKLHTYKIITRKIVKPTKVNDEYMKYTKWNYLTLLGCYPIGSDTNRILVVGELVEEKVN